MHTQPHAWRPLHSGGVCHQPWPTPAQAGAAAHGAAHSSRVCRCRTGPPHGAPAGAGESPPAPPQAPWALTFDMRERDTDWTDANKARLVALVAAQRLGVPMQQMEARLDDLVHLVPDLAGRVRSLHPGLLAQLVADMPATTRRLLGLRELLPSANVSGLVAARPQLLLAQTQDVADAISRLQQALRVPAVDSLVEAQPLLLVPECVGLALAELQRLLPGVDAAALLASDPSWVLRLQRGQQWLGQHPDSVAGEQIDWQPPAAASGGPAAAAGGGKRHEA